MHQLEQIDLGTVNEVRDRFSYPNNCHTICYLDQPLEKTVAIYLTASLKRDGYSDSEVTVVSEKGRVLAKVTGSGAKTYADFLPKYLMLGDLGLAGSKKLKDQGKWRYNWKFFLPHGLSMTRHLSVQLLHFPPDYVLERDQDYLSAHTTLRWAELLVENGALSDETARFQNIVDIAPIAAPSDDGKNLEGIYDVYNNYINGLLNLWVPMSDGKTRPLMAFGGPVRGWLKSQYGMDLKVLGLETLKLSSGVSVSVLAANHPSFIYNAVKRLLDDPNTPMDERVAVGMRVMQQDLIASAWQVKMSKEPDSDPISTLVTCTSKWSDPTMQRRICELTYQQALNKSPEESQKLCAVLPLPDKKTFGFAPGFALETLDARIEQLHEEIGAKESTNPADF